MDLEKLSGPDKFKWTEEHRLTLYLLKDEFGFDVDEAAKVLSKVFGLDEMPAGKLQAQYGQIGRPDGDHLYSFRCDHQATARKARQVMLEGLHRAVTEASHEEPGVFGLEHLSVSTPTKAQKRDRCPSYLTTFSNDFAEEVDDSRSKRKRKATNLNDIGDAKYLPPGHRIPEERSSTNTTPAKPRTPKSARGANPKVPFELPNGKIIMITESKADAAKAPLRWPMLNVVSLPCHSGTLLSVGNLVSGAAAGRPVCSLRQSSEQVSAVASIPQKRL